MNRVLLAEDTADGEAAYQRAATGDFDLILLDLMLPKKGGLEVLRALRLVIVRTCPSTAYADSAVPGH